MTGFFQSDGRITYPEADRLVEEYLSRASVEKATVTSRDVLRWSDYPDDRANQRRVHDALKRVCEPIGKNWAGRTLFEVDQP